MTKIIMRPPAVLGITAFDLQFNQFFTNPQPMIKRSTEGYPVTDIYQNELGDQVIEMALAGFDKEDLGVEIIDNKITISARSEKPPDMTQRRIAKRSFTKTFVDYHNQLNMLKANAEFVNGLLRIIIPQHIENKTVQIEIK